MESSNEAVLIIILSSHNYYIMEIRQRANNKTEFKSDEN